VSAAAKPKHQRIAPVEHVALTGASTGVSPFENLPSGWTVQKLKHIARVRLSSVNKKSEEGETPVRLCNYVDVYNNDRIRAGMDFMQATATHEEIERFTIQKGDVIITKDSETWDDIAVPALVADDLEGVLCGYHLALIRPTPGGVEGAYLARAFRAAGVAEQFKLAANGVTRFGVGLDGIGSALFPVPPLHERRAIAAFLDERTRRIDELIEKKQRFLDLLQEQRTALITRAVTKGLDPAAPMKPSGIDWLGDVPQHWGVKRLKFLLSESLQYGANEAAQLQDPDLPRFVRITDIDERGRLRPETLRSLPEDVAQPYMLRDGDLLLARSGATVGKAFLYDVTWGRCAYAGYLIRARLDQRRGLAKFVHLFTQSRAYWEWIGGSFIQATIQNVSAEKYGSLWLAVPPLDEQQRIIDYARQQDVLFRHLTDQVASVIHNLMEYRQALISAAVMGRINVRADVGERA
jgi:restriction endonuclease S subunit